MDFIAKSSSQGFYGEDQNQNQNQNRNKTQNQFMISTIRGKLPFSSSSSSTSSSSSPSSQPHKSLVPLPFHHHHQHQRGSWLENKFDPQQPSAEEISSIRCYPGGTANLELMDSSPVAGNNGDGDADAADDYNDVRRGDSSFDGLGLGGGGGGGSASASTVGVVVVDREHMFDKVVTPSDVGKLNRLVIPKQHAEKYFPLDSSTNEKGLLLNFEDRNGKPWRFRYSYWNSSQSYVMTKGWSRFVKEKKLDAGDIVSFQRGVGELGKDRLFIDWRRRPDAPELPSSSLPTLSHLLLPQQQQQYFSSSFHRSTTHPWSPHFLQPQARAPALRDHSQHLNAANYQPHSSSYGYSYSGSGGPYSYNSVVNPCSSSVIYLRSAAAVAPLQAGMVQVQSGVGGGGVNGGAEPASMVFESVPVVHGKAAAKRLRLFGVNMDCPISEESDECDILSSTTTIPPHATTMAPHLSSTPISPLQLRLYNSSPLPAMYSDLLPKANASNKSFDFDI